MPIELLSEPPYGNWTAWAQAPDVTELSSSYLTNLKHSFLEQRVWTEFAWVTVAVGTTNGTGVRPEALDSLKRLGFNPISRMSNRHPCHSQQKYYLEFWWKRMHDGVDPWKAGPVRVNRCDWGGYRDKSASGCGFNFGEPPLTEIKTRFFDFFSLLRIPHTDDKDGLYESHLKRFNFRKVDRGRLATFYVNGFDCDKWDWDAERAFIAKGEIIEQRQEAVDNIKVTLNPIKKPRKRRVAGLGVHRRMAIPAPIAEQDVATDKVGGVLNISNADIDGNI